MTHKAWLMACVCTLAIVHCTGGASAQTTPAQGASPSVQLGPPPPDGPKDGIPPKQEDDTVEVVVTSEKLRSTEQKTPVSMTVQSGQEMRREGRKRVDEVLQGVVGVAVQQTQVGPQLYMRGVGQEDRASATNETAVALYMDGVYQPRPEAIRGGTLDLERAEVLRGPQGTNLGGNSLAGAVNIVTGTPKFDYEASVSATFGNLDQVDTEAVVNVPLAENQAVRFAFGTQKRGPMYASGQEDSDVTMVRGRYRLQATPDLNIVYTSEYQKLGGKGPGQGTLCDTCDSDGNIVGTHYYRDRTDPWDDGTGFGAYDTFKSTTFWNHYANIDWNLGIGTLSIVPAWQYAHYFSKEAPRGNSFRTEDNTQKTEQLEIRLTSNPGSKIQWVVGGQLYHTNENGLFSTINTAGGDEAEVLPFAPFLSDPICEPLGTPIPETCDVLTAKPVNAVTSRSLFGQFRLPLTSRLRAVGGLRYSYDRKKIAAYSATVPSGAAAPGGDANFQTRDWDKITYRGGLEYDLTPKAMLYALRSTGYKSGTLLYDDRLMQFDGADPQTLTQSTLGMKSRWFDNRMKVNVELFDSAYDNYQVTIQADIVSGGCAASSASGCVTGEGNVKTLTSRGFDVDLDYRLTELDRVSFSAGYLEAKFGDPGELDQGYLDTLTTVPELQQALRDYFASYDGATLQNSPKWTANLTFEHRFNLGAHGRLNWRTHALYKTEYYTNYMGGSSINDTISVQPAYTTYDTYLTWERLDQNYTVTAYIKNISDYPVMTNYSAAAPGQAAGTVDLDLPRTYGVTISARF